MVFTDPPYNVDYSGRGQETSRTIKNDNMPEAKFRAFLRDAFAGMRQAADEKAPVYVCYASRTHREFEDGLNANGYEVKNQIIWVKAVASMGWGDYRWKHEPILYCRQAGKPIPFYGARDQYTEWAEELTDDELLAKVKAMIEKDESGGSTVWRIGRESNYVHPTQKPVQLVKTALKNSSRRGDVVYDPFAGSGSTLISCEQTRRRCFTMELDPTFCDVVVERWQQFTGQKAVLEKAR